MKIMPCTKYVLSSIAPRLSISPAVVNVVSMDPDMNVTITLTCTTSHPDVGTVWLVNGTNITSEPVHSVNNTLLFNVTSEELDDLEDIECAVYDPDITVTESVIISRARAEISGETIISKLSTQKCITRIRPRGRNFPWEKCPNPLKLHSLPST